MFSVQVYKLESSTASLTRRDGESEIKEATECTDGWTTELVTAMGLPPGNPRLETICGVFHLFRDVSECPHSASLLPIRRNKQLCILAIPIHMTGAEFCQFFGSFLQDVIQIQFVRNDNSSWDRCSALMMFENQSTADDFFKHFNGKPFSDLEEEICHVLFIADALYTESAVEASSPPIGLTELPTCPVCLERLDQHISGILTAVGNRLFHNSCISSWADSSCPVCRYCQKQSEMSTCSICSTSENLWICVICGFVGCGRYQEGHAIRHWKESQHCYSLEVKTQQVWDYVGDGYVHRLIQSKTDGKLVELNAPCQDGSDECHSCECSHGSEMTEAIINSKRDGIAAEYIQLLTSQLDKQRQYYEGLIADAKKERDSAITEAIDKAGSLKLQKMQAKLEETQMERRSLGEVNEAMKAQQEAWRSAIKASEDRMQAEIKWRDNQITDLEDQIRDLLVFVEGQRALSTTDANICDGTVLSLSTKAKQAKHSSKVTGRKKT